ncbi:uncharacterized protein LOC135214410 [Macrobrachium nipponense]|uniref:uncharacterized protein LOC135214410 n=1 Tax=Macrobrachium nipponense TaxID=159736 RepID=UPI0030C7F7CD
MENRRRLVIGIALASGILLLLVLVTETEKSSPRFASSGNNETKENAVASATNKKNVTTGGKSSIHFKSPPKNSLGAGPPEQISSQENSNCRSLFSITGTPRGELIVSKGAPVDEITSKGESSLPFAFPFVAESRSTSNLNRDRLFGSSVVEEVLRRRQGGGAMISSQEYQKLSLLLPRLVYHGNGTSERTKKEEETGGPGGGGEGSGENNRRVPPILLGDSRIAAAGGTLPFVPCAVAPYDEPSATVFCFRKRIETRGQLWLLFMGDSKVRFVMAELLNQLDHYYHFEINNGQNWSSVEHVRFKMNINAYSKLEPSLRIQFRMAPFYVSVASMMRYTDEVMQLQRWVAGVELPPDVLVIGYSSWLLERSRHDPVSHARETLDELHDLHKIVVPLLDQLSRQTRVLVLPQSRLRRTDPWYDVVLNSVMSDALFDWNDSYFLYELRKFREHSRDVNNVGYSANIQSDSTTVSIVNPEASDTVKQRQYVKLHNSILDKENKSTDGKETKNKVISVASIHKSSIRSNETSYRDHLTSGLRHPGLWWWDSSLPLNMADTSECNELRLRHGSHDLLRSRELNCNDAHHSGRITHRDLVTMLLNLMCNSILKSPREFCCS